jgi:methylmalonyl-CoA mutase
MENAVPPKKMESVPTPDVLTATVAQWRKTVEAELKGVPFEKKLVTRTPEGAVLQPLYTRLDVADLPDLAQAPGVAPFLRGTRASRTAARRWECGQEIPAATPAEFNRALRVALMGGQNSVSLPAGLIRAGAGDVGQALQGVAIDCVPVHLETGALPRPLAMDYLAAADRVHVPYAKLTGSVTADPLAAWVKTGSLGAPLAEQLDALAEWTSWAQSNAPALRTVGVSTVAWSEAGATATQELAFALAAGVEYLRELARRDVAVATTAGRVRFTFAVGAQFFPEIAKFRAFRLIWARALAAFGAGDAAKDVIVHARTGTWNKTLHDVHVNMLRVTTEACSAVLGGVDSLHISPYNEVGGAADEMAQRIARNVHTLLAEEFHFTDTSDPAGGSWYIENLTDDFARRAWKLFQEIEALGGYAAALRAGMPQKLVGASAAEKDEAVSKRRMGLIGTNLFPNLREKPTVVKASDAGAVAGATGCDEIMTVKARRAAEGFEELRRASDRFAQRTGARPKVFVAKMGPVKQHKARADFTAGFFAVGGFELAGKEAFDSAGAAAKAAVDSGAPIVVLCSTDETYPELVPAFGAALKTAKPEVAFVLAGLPMEATTGATFRGAGVDAFIHIRTNVREVLATFLKAIGALP